MIVNLLTYNRSDILKESMDSLAKHVTPEILHVIDDCSTENTEDILMKYQLNMCFNQNKINLGVQANNKGRLNNMLYDHEEFVYLTDSDVLYSSKFESELQKLKSVMERDKTILVGTLFNCTTRGHSNSIIRNYNEDYVVKKTCGGVSMLIRVEDFKNAIERYSNIDWDWAVGFYADYTNKKIIATKQSFIEHIGIIGVNSAWNDYDKATDFVL